MSANGEFRALYNDVATTASSSPHAAAALVKSQPESILHFNCCAKRQVGSCLSKNLYPLSYDTLPFVSLPTFPSNKQHNSYSSNSPTSQLTSRQLVDYTKISSAAPRFSPTYGEGAIPRGRLICPKGLVRWPTERASPPI